MARIVRWERPHLHTRAEGSSSTVASPDLFYDLVFAVVLAELAVWLGSRISWSGLLTFVLLTVPTVRLWITQTLYSDRFGDIDVSYRLFVFASMLAGTGLAVGANEGFGRPFPLFAVSVVASRVLLAAEWLRAARAVEAVRLLARRYLVFFSAESVLWIASALSSGEVRVLFAAAAVLTDLIVPLTTTRRQGELGEFSEEHLSDRFVDFFLIMLGQLVIFAILIMTRMRQPSASDILAGALSFGLAFVLWWVYVDHVVGRPMRRGTIWNASWVYLHIPLFASTVAFGSAFFTFVTRGERPVPDEALVLLCSSYALAMVLAGAAEIALVPIRDTPGRLARSALIHGVPALLALLVIPIARGWPPIPLLALLLVDGILAVMAGEFFRAGGSFGSAE